MHPGVRVLLVDDNATMRSALRGLLRSEPGYEVVGEAGDGATAVGMAARLAPDVILMDVQMPGEIDGIEATRRIVAAAVPSTPAPIVIVLSASADFTQETRDAGAAAFVPKDRAVELLTTIEDALADRRR